MSARRVHRNGCGGGRHARERVERGVALLTERVDVATPVPGDGMLRGERERAIEGALGVAQCAALGGAPAFDGQAVRLGRLRVGLPPQPRASRIRRRPLVARWRRGERRLGPR